MYGIELKVIKFNENVSYVFVFKMFEFLDGGSQSG